MIAFIGVMFATLLGVEPIVLPTPPAPVALCHYIDGWRGTNVPISPPSDSTDIVHAVAVAHRDEAIGWIIFRHDGKAFYFDGPVNQPPPANADSVIALKSLGLGKSSHRDVGRGQMIPLSAAVDVNDLINHGFGLYTCY